MSFGFKYGPPAEADMLFDLRFLPNPYFDPELRPKTGKDTAVRDYVHVSDLAGNVAEWVSDSAQSVERRGLRLVLGSSWSEDWSQRHHEVTWRNARPDTATDFYIGLRCARSPEPARY